MRTADRGGARPTVLVVADLRNQATSEHTLGREVPHEPTSETHGNEAPAPHERHTVVSASTPTPPAVTFKSGADLLVELGIVDRMSHQGVRHIADTDPKWPFGEGREHPYWTLSNATVMATEPFLEFFRERERQRATGTSQ